MGSGRGKPEDDPIKCSKCDDLSTLVPDCFGNNDGLCDACRKKQTTSEMIINSISSQDTQQLITVTIQLLTQLYQMTVSSLLILLVPQNCAESGSKVETNCDMSDKFSQPESIGKLGLALNFLTMLMFLGMYTCEYRRENYLISNMDVNDDEPQDGDDVLEKMNLLEKSVSDEIKNRDKWYVQAFRVSALFFIANTIISYMVISKKTGQLTMPTFITSMLFMLFKVLDVYATTSAEDGVFISAYMKVKVQFNDVDDSVYNAKALAAKAEAGGEGGESVAVETRTPAQIAQDKAKKLLAGSNRAKKNKTDNSLPPPPPN
jgi:hypothetical protein